MGIMQYSDSRRIFPRMDFDLMALFTWSAVVKKSCAHVKNGKPAPWGYVVSSWRGTFRGMSPYSTTWKAKHFTMARKGVDLCCAAQTFE